MVVGVVAEVHSVVDGEEEEELIKEVGEAEEGVVVVEVVAKEEQKS